MLIYIILLWVLIELSAPTWCYVLLGIAGMITILKWGMALSKSTD